MENNKVKINNQSDKKQRPHTTDVLAYNEISSIA